MGYPSLGMLAYKVCLPLVSMGRTSILKNAAMNNPPLA
jgi:hypothetical protein